MRIRVALGSLIVGLMLVIVHWPVAAARDRGQ